MKSRVLENNMMERLRKAGTWQLQDSYAEYRRRYTSLREVSSMLQKIAGRHG